MTYGDMTGRTALVIGGSRGIGAAVCRVCISSGCDIAFTHLGSPEDNDGAAVIHVCAQSHGKKSIDIVLDCTDETGTVRFVERIISERGRIDYLVYSAGFTSPKPFMQLAAEEWRRIVDINLNGAFIAIHAVLPAMMKQGGGSIVLIGSAAIISGGGGRADYVSAKAGLEGLNRAVTKEFAPHNIRCNLVHPSLIETDLLRQRHPDPEKRAELARGVPLRRLGQPEDVAHLVCFLLSDLSGYITGQSILVDGGRSYCG